jgi:hypothetical protein
VIEITEYLMHGDIHSENKNENAQAEVINVMTPIIHETIDEMNSQARETMCSIRDTLFDARNRDAAEMNKILVNTIPAISDSITPVLQKGAMSAMARVTNGMLENTANASQTIPIHTAIPSSVIPKDFDRVTDAARPGIMDELSSRRRTIVESRSHSRQTSTTRPNRHRRHESSSSETESDGSIIPHDVHPRDTKGCNPRLPAFTGKDWKIWINRFEDVAIIRGWSEQQKIG